MGVVVIFVVQWEFVFNCSDFEKVRKMLMSQVGICLVDFKDGMVYSCLVR